MVMKYITPKLRVVNIASANICAGSGTIKSGGPLGEGNHGISGAKGGFFDSDDYEDDEN